MIVCNVHARRQFEPSDEMMDDVRRRRPDKSVHHTPTNRRRHLPLNQFAAFFPSRWLVSHVRYGEIIRFRSAGPI